VESSPLEKGIERCLVVLGDHNLCDILVNFPQFDLVVSHDLHVPVSTGKEVFVVYGQLNVVQGFDDLLNVGALGNLAHVDMRLLIVDRPDLDACLRVHVELHVAPEP